MHLGDTHAQHASSALGQQVAPQQLVVEPQQRGLERAVRLDPVTRVAGGP